MISSFSTAKVCHLTNDRWLIQWKIFFLMGGSTHFLESLFWPIMDRWVFSNNFEKITHLFNKTLLILFMLHPNIKELLQFMCHILIRSHKMSKYQKHALKDATP